jgi:crotonobetainyl-CoA:carnitine CoA-transferase CaiB-like acyl-CoA transferase
MLGTAVWQMALELLAPPAEGSRGRNPENPLAAPYRCAGERFVVLAMHDEERQWPTLCAALAREDLLADARFSSSAGRKLNREALRAVLREEFAARDSSHWSERLAQHGCAAGVAQTLEDVRRDPLVLGPGFLQSQAHAAGSLLAATPIAHDGAIPRIRRRAPRLGEHSAEILAGLGPVSS